MAAWIAGAYFDRREATGVTLRKFGETFIREFERPLIQQPCTKPPLRSRLHIIPDRERLEIHFAPYDGRHYPNLSDHRKNVEYDVDRVVQLLGDKRFVSDQLVARGPWVVIPFKFEPSIKQEGVA